MPLHDEAALGALAGWLPHQRWYAGKGRDVSGHVVESSAELGTVDDATLHHVVVRVDYAAGDPEHYQLRLGERAELPARLEHATIAPAGRGIVYDAVHDADLTSVLLRH